MKQILAVIGVLALAIGVALAQQTSTAQQLTITNGPGVDNLSANSAEVFWNTNQNSGSVVLYGTSRDMLTESAEVPGDVTNHKVQIDKLQPDTTYFFQVISAQTDADADEAKSDIGIFKTPSASQAQNEANPDEGK
jgi:phosphodiesterase/alkaline phosphatase D-like protein